MTTSQNAPQAPRLSDEELEYYGDLYIRCKIREAGVDFENFLSNPEYYLQKHARKFQANSDADGNGRRRSLRKFLHLG